MSQSEPQQIKAVASQVLKTWWFWLGFAAVVWSGLLLVENITHYQAKRFEGELSQSASNQMAQSLTVISNAMRERLDQTTSNQLTKGFGNISNQIAAALSQPRIQATIRSVASQQATQLLLSAVSPAISNFEANLAQARTRLDTAAPPHAPVTKVTPANGEPATTGGIVFDAQSVTRQGASYVLTLRFKRIDDKPLGTLHFSLGAYNQLPARILGVDAASDVDPNIESAVDSSGLEATLSFSLPQGVDPAIKLLVSGTTVIEVSCDALAAPVRIPVVVNLPAATSSK
jgi:hypothetical protein